MISQCPTEWKEFFIYYGDYSMTPPAIVKNQHASKGDMIFFVGRDSISYEGIEMFYQAKEDGLISVKKINHKDRYRGSFFDAGFYPNSCSWERKPYKQIIDAHEEYTELLGLWEKRKTFYENQGIEIPEIILNSKNVIELKRSAR